MRRSRPRSAAGALAAAVLLLGLLAAPAGGETARTTAVPGPGARPNPPGLADRDSDGLSDELEADVRSRGPRERIGVVVTFDGPGGVASARREVGRFRVVRRFDLIRGFAAEMRVRQAVALASAKGVFRVESDFDVEATLDAATADFGVRSARTDFVVDGTGVEVCVVDTGADPNHESLDSKSPIPFFDAVGGQLTAYDDNGHGTHVASIAVGDGTGSANAAKYAGVAPGAGLSAAKVLNFLGSGTASQVNAGIDWCANRPSVRVISMSLGTSTSSDGLDSISQTVDSAVINKGKVVVVAAGNSGDNLYTVGSPGAAVQALTVGAGAEHSAPAGAANHSDGVYLAYFSSRGPTLDERTKPDVTAAGVSITAALAGSPTGYTTYSGTSMATPFVSGTVALALDAAPGWSPANVRAAVEGTAQDRGAAGKDVDWGAGLLDGYAVVAAASAGVGTTSFPASQYLWANVPDHGTWTHSFDLGSGDLGTPIAATILIDGALECVFWWGGFCLDYNWGPDLDTELWDPNGNLIAISTCAAGTECGVGRQETLHAMPTVAGTYTILIYPYEGEPFNGRGGWFGVDLSAGSLGAPPPPPPPPEPQTTHVSDLDGSSSPSGSRKWTITVTIWTHDGTEAPLGGVTVSATWQGGRTTSCTTDAAGACTVSRRYSKSKATAWLRVDGLSASGYTYDAAANHDPDGDSDGTTITVARP